MIPKRILLENFLSFGEPATEIAFDEDEPLWVLSGPNGIGKSAVFDAITYCLFGCHRGGKGQGMDRLVRHGTNGFRVEFEFTFAGRNCRIIRNYGKKSVERVFLDGREVDLPTGKNKVRDWAERELGLTHDQFTASVLLKQGEADKIITGTGKDRLEMLKKIIGVERYEALSGRVKEAAGRAKAVHDRLEGQLQEWPPVTDEELAAARQQVEAAEAHRTAAQDAEARAGGHVEQAKAFEKCERTRAELDGRLAAADDRRATAADIRAKHAKLTELAGVVPTLLKVVSAREELRKLDPQLKQLKEREAKLTGEIKQATESRDAAKTAAEQHGGRAAELAAGVAELQRTMKADRELVPIAEEVEEIDRKLAEIPTGVAELLDAAQIEQAAAEGALTRVTELRSSCEALLGQRKTDLKNFDTVEVGVKCSRCRQPVDEKHAADERSCLTVEIQKLEDKYQTALADERTAAARSRGAKSAYKLRTTQAGEKKVLDASRLALARHGEVPAVGVVQTRIAEAKPKLERLQLAETEERRKCANQTKAAKDFETARVGHERDGKQAKADHDKLNLVYVRAETQLATWVGTLPGGWAARWESLRAAEVQNLEDELSTLKASDIATQFQMLQEDHALRDEWKRRLADTLAEIEGIPPQARVAVKVAEDALRTARQTAKDAAAAVTTAERAAADLTLRVERRAKLAAEERAAERAARHHATLDKKLGVEGLQRELVRSAERLIVTFANETVRNLSDGELTIELDNAEDGPDKAFTLKVRRADSEAIGVHYLSGSQKFRVAVAVALAIGRFATAGTQARPLECVIIDEGFGSLDQDGLRATAEELNRLKKHLRRIILVSHQEEFTKHFPLVYRLHKGENGTTAKKDPRG